MWAACVRALYVRALYVWPLYVRALYVWALYVSTLCATFLCEPSMCEHSMCEHSMCDHSMWALYVWPLYGSTLCVTTLCKHSMCGHSMWALYVWPLYGSTLCVTTLCVGTLCEHSMRDHSMWALYVWPLYGSTLCVTTLWEHSMCDHSMGALYGSTLYVSSLCVTTLCNKNTTTKTPPHQKYENYHEKWTSVLGPDVAEHRKVRKLPGNIELQFLGRMLQRKKRQKSTGFIVKTPVKSIGEHRKARELPGKMNIEEVEEPKKHENLQTKPVLDPFKSTADTRKVRELPRKMSIEEVEEPETTKIYRQNPRASARPPRKLRKFKDETNMQARNHENSDEFRPTPLRHLDLDTPAFYYYRKNPKCYHTVWGKRSQKTNSSMWDLKQKGWDPISWNPAPPKTTMDTKNHHAFEECSSLNLDSGNGKKKKKTNHKGAGIFIRCIPYVDQPRAPFFSGIFEWRKLLLQNGGCQSFIGR